MHRITLGLFASLGAALAVTPALAWTPSARADRVLVAGQPWAEVLPDTDGAGMIHAAIDISAPPRAVWAVMTDCRKAALLVTSIISCRVLQNDWHSGWDVRETVTKGNMIVPTIHNVVRADYQPYSLIRFHRVGGDMAIEEGEWRLQPLAGGKATRVIYVNRVAVNIPAPAVLVRAGMRGDVSKVLVNLRRASVGAGS